MTDDRPAWARRIAAERAARDWSQRDAVRALRAHAPTELPADESMIRQWKRWESGQMPNDFYQPIIAALFGTVTHALFPAPSRRDGEKEILAVSGMETLEIMSRLNRSDVDNAYRDAYAAVPFLCDGFPYHQSVDLPDPSRSEFNAAYQWNLVTGPQGSIVDRYQIDKLTDLTPGGAAQSLVAVPYYRDDSCFDDGTGTDPGPRVRLRSADEPRTTATGEPRKCWRPSDGLPDGSDRFFQGSIATHGVHILAIAESDNARQTVPLTEIVADQRLVMLPGWRDGTTGEQYGRGFEHQYVRTVVEPANPPSS